MCHVLYIFLTFFSFVFFGFMLAIWYTSTRTKTYTKKTVALNNLYLKNNFLFSKGLDKWIFIAKHKKYDILQW